MDEDLVQACGKMRMLDQLLPRLKAEGRKVRAVIRRHSLSFVDKYHLHPNRAACAYGPLSFGRSLLSPLGPPLFSDDQDDGRAARLLLAARLQVLPAGR